MNFSQKVFEVVKKIPKGKISTYKNIAIKIKSPNSFRAVGNVLNKNIDFENVPCHRVIKNNGEIGGYVKGQGKKIKLLISEGIIIENKKINIDKFLFKF